MRLYLGLVLLLIVLSSCSVDTSEQEAYASSLESDFEPPIGKDDDAPEPDTSEENPSGSRLVIATSSDGINWDKQDESLVDQAGAPSAVVDSEGTIWVYYMTHAEGLENTIVAAISEDNGDTWTDKIINFDLPVGGKAADPAVVMLEDNTFRMYFTGQFPGDGHRVIRSAVSEDGINYEIEDGIRVSEVPGNQLYPIANTVTKLGDTWHFYCLASSDQGMVNAHLTSTDGLTFENPELILSNQLFANAITVDDEIYSYGMRTGPEGNFHFEIYLSISQDGYKFESQELFSYDGPQDYFFVKEPTVVQLSDGSFVMYYVTVIE